MTSKKRVAYIVLALLIVLIVLIGRRIYGAVEQAQKNAELIAAIKHGDPGAVEMLLQKGADANAREVTDSRTLWQRVRDLVLHRTPPGRGTPALVVAMNNGPNYVGDPRWKVCEPMLLALVKHGADPNVKGEIGGTPLIFAVITGHSEIVQTLLTHGANVNYKTNDGNTVLLIAFYFNSPPIAVKIVKMLLEHGAVANVTNNYGVTPLKLAVRAKRPDLIRLLRQYGAKQ